MEREASGLFPALMSSWDICSRISPDDFSWGERSHNFSYTEVPNWNSYFFLNRGFIFFADNVSLLQIHRQRCTRCPHYSDRSFTDTQGTMYTMSALQGTMYKMSALQGTMYKLSVLQGTVYKMSASQGTVYKITAAEVYKHSIFFLFFAALRCFLSSSVVRIVCRHG